MKDVELVVHGTDAAIIDSVSEWLEHAPPAKGEAQWVAGRSARESAEAWFRTGAVKLPSELLSTLRSHRMTTALTIHSAVPEMWIPLDTFKGNTRNADVVLYGSYPEGSAVVTVEAKADEPFGRLIGEYYDSKNEMGSRSKVPDRIDALSRVIFGRSLDSTIRDLRYQLLHGVAACLIEAGLKGASLAVFLVHEFVTDKTRKELREANRADLKEFVVALGLNADIKHGSLVGPIAVHGGGFVRKGIPLLIGLAEYRTTADSTA